MANTDVSITIRATDSFSAVLDAYNAKLNQANQATKEASQSAAQASTSFGQDLGAALAVGAAAIAAATVAWSALSNTINQGIELNRIADTFDQLAGGVGRATDMLAKMTEATHGLVDDDTLMQAANKLMLEGLVKTSDEAAKLTGIAVSLGRAVGMNAADAINSFGQILETQSTRGLARFGFNIGAVKEEIDRLTASGMSARDAFQTAMFDQGTQAVQRLGDSATVTGTAWERLQVQVGDTVDAMKQKLAELGNSVAQGLLDAANPPVDQTTAWVEAIYNTISSDFSDLDPTFLKDFIRRGIDAVKNDPQLQNMAQDISSAAQIPLDSVYNGDIQTISEYNDLLVKIAPLIQGMQAGATAQTQINSGLAAYNQLLGYAQRGTDLWGQGMAYIRSQYDAFTQQENMQTAADYMGVLSDKFQELNTFMQNAQSGGSFNGITLFSPDDAANAKEMATQFQNALDSVRVLHDQGIVSDADYKNAQAMANSVTQFANDAQRGADTLMGMNLSQLMGQQSGGPAGEVVTQVEQFLQNEGTNVDQLKQIKDAMELVTGQQTAVSQNFQNTILPELATIAKTMGGTTAGQAAQGYANYLQQSALQGTTANAAGAQTTIMGALYSPEGSSSEGASLLTSGNQAAPVTAAQNLSSSLSDAAASSDKIATNTSTISDNLNTVATKSSTFQDNMTKARTQSGGVLSDLSRMVGRPWSIDTKIVISSVDDRTGMLGAILQASNSQTIQTAQGGLRASQSNGISAGNGIGNNGGGR